MYVCTLLQNEAVKKMFVYYDACVNTSQINRVRGLPLSQVIAKYGSWNITDKNWNESNWNLIESLATIHRDLGAMALFKINAEPDYKNSARNILTVFHALLIFLNDMMMIRTRMRMILIMIMKLTLVIVMK